MKYYHVCVGGFRDTTPLLRLAHLLVDLVRVGCGVVIPEANDSLDLLEAFQQVVQRLSGLEPRQRRVHGLDARTEEAEGVRRDGVAHLF